MSNIRERLREEWSLVHEEARSAMTRETWPTREQRQRFEEEKEPMISQHRELFEKLTELGIVDILREATANGLIHPYATREEQGGSIDLKAFYDKTRQKSKEQPEKAVDYIREMSFPKWYGAIKEPYMNLDGSAGNVLRIDMYNTSLGGAPHSEDVNHVHISYSPLGVLTIRGRQVFYSDIANEGHIDLEAITGSFVKALARPEVEHNQRNLTTIPNTSFGNSRGSSLGIPDLSYIDTR